MHMRDALLHLSVLCGVVGRNNNIFNAAFTSPIHVVKQATFHTPAANVEILYILPSPQLPLYITAHNIIYTKTKMHSDTYHPPTVSQHLEDVDMDTLSRAETLTTTATRDGATAGDSIDAGESTAAEEV